MNNIVFILKFNKITFTETLETFILSDTPDVEWYWYDGQKVFITSVIDKVFVEGDTFVMFQINNVSTKHFYTEIIKKISEYETKNKDIIDEINNKYL